MVKNTSLYLETRVRLKSESVKISVKKVFQCLKIASHACIKQNYHVCGLGDLKLLTTVKERRAGVQQYKITPTPSYLTICAPLFLVTTIFSNQLKVTARVMPYLVFLVLIRNARIEELVYTHLPRFPRFYRILMLPK